jgi:histone-lysine N-methyltransferase SETD1
MSRASKGFADFFPQAPSVIQSKKTKPIPSRKRKKSPESEPTPVPQAAAGVASDHGSFKQSTLTNGAYVDNVVVEPLSVNRYESENVPGDLLNGVGTASSTSTTSSIFSTNRQVDHAHHRGEHRPSTLTPLTNAGSSPPSTNKSPAHKPDSGFTMNTSKLADVGNMVHIPTTLTPVATPNAYALQLPPLDDRIKVVKIVYDPELAPKSSSKEKRGRVAEYVNIERLVRHDHFFLELLRALR